MKRISTRQSKRIREYAKVRKEYLAAHPKCEWCGYVGVLDIHHAYGRIGRLLCDTRGFRALCRECHDDVSNYPELARAAGMLCPYGHWNSWEALDKACRK